MRAKTGTPEQWGVVVDECRLNSIGRGTDWWATFWMRMEPTERIVELDQSIAGGWFHVAYDDKGDANLGREFMAEQGIHPRCLKVMTLASARKSVRRKHQTSPYREQGHSCMYCEETP